MKRHLSILATVTMAFAAAGCGTRVERSAAPANSTLSAPGEAAGVPGSAPPVATEAGGGASVAGASTGAVSGSGDSGPTPGTKASSAASGATATGRAGGGSNPASGATAGAVSGGTSRSPTAPGQGSPAPGTPGPSAAAPGAPGGPAGPKGEIKIGEVGVFSGPIGANMKPISDSVRIWVRWINDRGGINGHPVSLLTGDSAADPARHRALVQQLVDKGVIAFVGQPGEVFSGGGSVQYLTQQRVPVIGSEGGADWFYQSPVYFPQIQHGRALVQALATGTAKEAVARGKSKLAIWTCVEAQVCKDVDEIVPKVTPKYGVTVVNSSKVSIGQPDFTAECLSTRNAGAEMIFMAADGATISRGAASCTRQGYRPTWVLIGATILAKQHAEDPNLNNAIGVDTQAPWFLDNSPGRKEWRDGLARYAPDLSTTSSNMIGWVAAKLFEYAMKKGPEPYTRESLLASLWSTRGDPLPDLTVPYLFNPEKPATPTTCFWNVTPTDGKWTSADGGQRHCFDYDPNL